MSKYCCLFFFLLIGEKTKEICLGIGLFAENSKSKSVQKKKKTTTNFIPLLSISASLLHSSLNDGRSRCSATDAVS